MTDNEQHPLDALIEEQAAQVAKTERGAYRRLHNQFVPRHLKIHLAKAMINYTAPRLNKLIPTREPTCLVSKIVDNTFRNLDKMVKLKKSMKDRHFLQLLEATRRTLIFIAEDDCYYRAWLELLFVTLYQDVKQNVPGLTIIDKQLQKERATP